MIESVQFAGAEEFAAGLITHEGVVFPGVPQPFGDVEKFAGNAVTQAVFRVFSAREVLAEPSSGDVTTFQPARPWLR